MVQMCLMLLYSSYANIVEQGWLYLNHAEICVYQYETYCVLWDECARFVDECCDGWKDE